MPFLGLGYRRPARVDRDSIKRNSLDSDLSEPDSFKSNISAASNGIPGALSFDKIMSGGTCPPMTVRDFMNYLIYIERSAENLQFYLWYEDFVKRFQSASTSDLALAPKWTKGLHEDALAMIVKDAHGAMHREPKGAAEMFKGTDFAKKPGNKSPKPGIPCADPFATPPRTPNDTTSDFGAPVGAPVGGDSYREIAGEAFDAVGIKRPFTVQPFREEIDRVVATYIADNAPRQLNLSDREQRITLAGLAYTTHPSALRTAVKVVETSLRGQAHPNFVRWSICNGNPARVFFARFLGVFLIVGATLAAILLALSDVARAYRAVCAVGWVLGIATLIAAWKGMCVVLHGMHHRHIRPWELFTDCDSESGNKEKTRGSFESFGSSNSYEDEPWVVKYEKRNLVRKIFDREVWIQEPALRQIQDTIFIQAMLFALITSGILTAIFVLVPSGSMY
ncbi:hypothetical protein MKZ38_004626 [Zalerion maritima]|uniref:Regulator of G protein signaling superfamily n=1 Tax=Zalerion maritima TaxID=339359 RepID=A0AAD5RLF7_9PEZI|nr:hypothetical protein MKZ38_004626 [Zalerion maritima]